MKMKYFTALILVLIVWSISIICAQIFGTANYHLIVGYIAGTASTIIGFWAIK